MGGDVVANKAVSLERCLHRIRQLCPDGARSLQDQTVEEAVVLNIQRACEQAIALASHVASARRLGLPQDARHAFELLRDAGILSTDLADRMKRMVGFRNIAIHEYQRLDKTILASIVENHLVDFQAFLAAVVQA